MSEFAAVLALAMMPALGNFAGGLIAELAPASDRVLSGALHAAAGLVVGVVAVELMPTALGGTAPPWAIVIGLCLGGIFYAGLEWFIDNALGGNAETAGAWMIYTTVSIDLFSDGLMIGVGSVVSFGLAFILALGQVMADLPEGYAALANFRDKGEPRGRRLLLSASFALPCLVGAALGYWLLRDQTETLKFAALSFVSGVLLIAAVEDMIGEAHEAADDRLYTALLFIGGFALFTLVASYLRP